MTHIQVFERVDGGGCVARCTCGWCTDKLAGKPQAIRAAAGHRLVREYLELFDLAPAVRK
jgi:hypothetical protein